MIVANCLFDLDMTLGECPRWHPQEQRLYWTDIEAKLLYRSDGRGRNPPEQEAMPGRCACFAFLPDGEMLLAVETSIMHWRGFGCGQQPVALASVPAADLLPDLRFNDGGVDPAGRFVLGTIDPTHRQQRGALYSFDPARRKLELLRPGFAVFNGLAFSPDGDWAWFTDTPQRKLFRAPYDPATGKLGEVQTVLSLPTSEPGRPDGASFDREGNYWCALYNGSKLIRVDPKGKISATITVPASYPTMCCFGGPNLSRIYVTSAQRSDDQAEKKRHPQAGALFVVDEPGCRGLPTGLARAP